MVNVVYVSKPKRDTDMEENIHYNDDNAPCAEVGGRKRCVLWREDVVGRPNVVALSTESLVVGVYGIVE